MFRKKRDENTQIIEPGSLIKTDKPHLKNNRPESKKMELYVYIEPKNTEELKKYYEKLRILEEISEDKLGNSTMQVQIKGSENVDWIPSLLGSCFRDDNDDYAWYDKTKIENSHHLVKLKRFYNFDEDDVFELIKETKLIYEDDDILIVNYNFSINS